MEIIFDNPKFLWFLLALPFTAIAHYYDWRFKKQDSLMFSNFEAAERVFKPMVTPSYPLQLTITILIFLCLVFSAAGINIWYTGVSTDINFAVAIDASSSMSSEDLKPSRLGVAKESAFEFIDSLPRTSKIVVVSFAGASFVEQTLTDDHGKIKEAIANIRLKSTGGTDVGMAIITATNLLLVEEDKPKSILLLTDGQSTVGIPVQDAVEYVKKMRVSVNTIGIGTSEGGGFFGEEGTLTQLDDTTLEEIAADTGGRHYTLESKENFGDIYEEIGKAIYKNMEIGLTPYLIAVVLMLMILNWLLSFTRFSSLP